MSDKQLSVRQLINDLEILAGLHGDDCVVRINCRITSPKGNQSFELSECQDVYYVELKTIIIDALN